MNAKKKLFHVACKQAKKCSLPTKYMIWFKITDLGKEQDG